MINDDKMCYVLGSAIDAFDNDAPWNVMPEWRRQEMRGYVDFWTDNPELSAKDVHEKFLAEKKADGWRYALETDSAKKLSAELVDWDSLPREHRMKQTMIRAMVLALVFLK